MKKILFVFSLIICFGVAANAQSNAKVTDSSTDAAKVNVAGQSISEDVVAEPSPSTGSKSCCSSKRGKETANTGKKSCCTDGKKSAAHCSEMKREEKTSE